VSKKRLILVYAICILIILVATYPLVETFIISKSEQNQEIKLFEERWEDFGYTEEEINELIKKEEPGNYSVSLGKVNIVGILQIPKIGLKIPIYDNSSPRAIENGAGIIEGTGDLFSKGKVNPILTAHNGMVNKNLFMNLPKMEIGDQFFVKTALTTSQYKVVAVETKLPEYEVEYLMENFNDNTYMTLRTCVPTGINSHRLLVIGVFEKYVQKEVMEEILQETSFIDEISFIHYFCIGSILLAIVFIIIVTRKHLGGTKRKKYDKRNEEIN
jgi:sortase A